ncbi:aldo/keto reductase [Acetatifactor muris]|uniref:General stress protein 69 n=1 Tax=Acetatifactor muris TaxID=879566 RepID=A0A2K4ZCG2_9FIRM|nr:aldo/keto reductase [Acetatifactor muris]MCR2046571.1 aldo/keto reductase [Acetatifactor muris]SOY28160.1 General stress protein 69 [Acetatifactor muris]
MNSINLILGTMTFGESVFSPEVSRFINAFLDAGYAELDTAYVYNEGSSEKLIGEVIKEIDKPYKISTKVNPRVFGKLDSDAAYKQIRTSLLRLCVDCVDTFYLHFPDPATPVNSVLEACENLYSQGKIRELGLSNFPAWMVADIWHICDKNGWIKPTVYEGIYNPLTRKAETELKDCLGYFGLRFNAYNPMAGGLLTGRYGKVEDVPTVGRFTHRPNYQNRYWKKSYFEAVEIIKEAASNHGITSIEATYRWLAYHSMLNVEQGDGIILGASKVEHLIQNMEAVKAGPLPEDILKSFEQAWEITKQDSPEYFTLYKGGGSVGGKRGSGG